MPGERLSLRSREIGRVRQEAAAAPDRRSATARTAPQPQTTIVLEGGPAGRTMPVASVPVTTNRPVIRAVERAGSWSVDHEGWWIQSDLSVAV
jgi:hypothetical protein